jgi:excisionase family DNA binding protein
LLTPEEAADRLRVSKGTLCVWRCTKRYPLPFVKVGSKVFYRSSAIEAFITAREVQP